MRTALLLQLLRLASPGLPIGAYAYSQGLEQAVAWSWIHDEATALAWIRGLLLRGPARLDLPVLKRLYEALQQGDRPALDRWSQFLAASREARELQDEDRALGGALAVLLADLGDEQARPWITRPEVSLPVAFALAGHHWGLPLTELLAAYLWVWTEHQVGAVVKLVPLGQTAGQRLLSATIVAADAAMHLARTLPDEELGMLAPGHAIACACHEVQYTRLFRS